MGRRAAKSAAEDDVFTRWRRVYCYTQRAGVTSSIKRGARRRERHNAKRQIQRGDD